MLRKEKRCATVKRAQFKETHAMTNPSPESAPVPTTDLDNRITGCLLGAFPWDDWQREALAAGLSPELATLGQAVMREAYQHHWCDRLKYECGIDNAGTAAGMIACAKDQPWLTERRWQWLLATDGLRFDPWEHQERLEDSPEWNELRQRWEAEQTKELPREVVLQKEAIRYIEEFYGLDQLAIIDLQQQAVGQTPEATILWADFTVIGTEIPHQVSHSGVVRIELDAAGTSVDAAIFERVEES
jgi:hypothetical protein